MIVVGVDDTVPSRRALCWGYELARVTGMELLVVTVWSPVVSYAWLGGGWVVPDAFEDGVSASEALLELLVADELGPDPVVPVTTRVLTGGVVPALVEVSKGASMLVLGSRGHGALVGALLGSVSAPCAERAACPVLVVHEDNPPPRLAARGGVTTSA